MVWVSIENVQNFLEETFGYKKLIKYWTTYSSIEQITMWLQETRTIIPPAAVELEVASHATTDVSEWLKDFRLLSVIALVFQCEAAESRAVLEVASSLSLDAVRNPILASM